jgi:hypothetical protein
MKIPGLTDSGISSSVEGAEAANRASGMRRAIHRMRGWFLEYEPAHGGAEVTGLDEAREHTEVLTEGIRSLEPAPVRTDAKGQVVDMERHRRIRQARAERDEAFETMPKPEPPSELEDLFIK